MLEYSILNEFINKIDFKNENIYEAIYYELGFIPNRFHREFLQDVINDINYQTVRSVHKNGNYFLEAIWEDMTDAEREGDFWCDIGCIGKMSNFYNRNMLI